MKIKLKLRRFRIAAPSFKRREKPSASMIETMLKRVSCRTYLPDPIDEEKKQSIRTSMMKHTKGPFGNTVRFQLVDFSSLSRDEIKSLSTYGVIKGAGLFVVGIVKNQLEALEDFGYCMEKVVLEATRLGLGTCWLGASFRRKSFQKVIQAGEDDLIPAITPVGYAAEKKSVTESMVRVLAGSDLRKPWTKLFFQGNFMTPLQRETCGMFQVPLEMVRIAPSASNRQPWRVLKEEGKNHFHFYMRKPKAYEPLNQAVPFQPVDIGIAICHFELAAHEAGLKGRWRRIKSRQDTEELDYVVSWMG